MYVYTSTNHCLCTPAPPGSPPDPECPDDCNCLKVCSVFINPDDTSAPLPCGKTFTLNVMDEAHGHDFCACGEDTPRWTVEYKDTDVFVTATITRAGVLTAITAGPEALVKGIGEIILKVCCGPLSAYTQVLIGVKDPCDGCPECGDCEVPDPCTCICENAEIELFLNTVPYLGDTTLE